MGYAYFGYVVGLVIGSIVTTIWINFRRPELGVMEYHYYEGQPEYTKIVVTGDIDKVVHHKVATIRLENVSHEEHGL